MNNNELMQREEQDVGSVFTKAQLVEIWKRPVERQYNVAISKIIEAIQQTDGDISICFSGGKDSTLLLDMYSEIVSQIKPNAEIDVCFANTTNETNAMISFVKNFIAEMERKYAVKLNFKEIRPNIPWAKVVQEVGIPLISKEQAKAIRYIRRDMDKTGVDYETVIQCANQSMKSVNELIDLGFSASGILSLTGFVSKRKQFGKHFMLSKKWLPMLNCGVKISEQCCAIVKEKPLSRIEGNNIMTGEQASESKKREATYLRTGCNYRTSKGVYKSKPFGAMTQDGILFALQYRGIPICSDYGEIIKTEDGHYKCTKTNRTGCALCGFGCQYDTERFVRLQESEPAKVKFAFKPMDEGGAGYREAIEYMNEHCGTKVKIPKV